MRTVNLIQFTEVPEPEHGYEPTMNQVYRVLDLEDQYYYEVEDDDGDSYEETLDSISILADVMHYGTSGSSIRKKKRHVINSDLTYNLLTIELDDDCDLFT